MSQTPEDRIRRQYLALKRRHYRDDQGLSLSSGVLLALARQWKRPIAEVKRICNYRQGQKRS